MVTIELLSLSGPFKRVETKTVRTHDEALEVARAHAEPHGFTHVRLVQGDDPYSGARITAKTPGGRSGRNIAFVEYDYE